MPTPITTSTPPPQPVLTGVPVEEIENHQFELALQTDRVAKPVFALQLSQTPTLPSPASQTSNPLRKIASEDLAGQSPHVYSLSQIFPASPDPVDAATQTTPVKPKTPVQRSEKTTQQAIECIKTLFLILKSEKRVDLTGVNLEETPVLVLLEEEMDNLLSTKEDHFTLSGPPDLDTMTIGPFILAVLEWEKVTVNLLATQSLARKIGSLERVVTKYLTPPPNTSKA